jgi:hypothetical protein
MQEEIRSLISEYMPLDDDPEDRLRTKSAHDSLSPPTEIATTSSNAESSASASLMADIGVCD